MGDTGRTIDGAATGAVDEAAACLAAGGLVALPTETVYGLAAGASSAASVARVFAAKGRPSHNPLIVHVADVDTARAIGILGPTGDALAAAFWPGPLTLVAMRRDGAAIAEGAAAGGPTVALRMPDAPFMRAVIAKTGPLVAPSANRSGRVSATSATAVADELGTAVDLIVDGGPSPIGVESTVVDITGVPRILRPGAIGRAALEAVAGPLAEPQVAAAGPLRSPGLLASHYAPRAKLRLDVEPADVRPGEGWLALGQATSDAGEAHTVRLSPGGDLDEAARGLYAGLRALDRIGVATIAVSPIPAEGIGIALRDRLGRAAAPRPPETPGGETGLDINAATDPRTEAEETG
ncbi:L-threonylcarbamoyladenylate synthase [Acuticoccus sp. MNP-M23]|uniref:L-threonylcarbamoyladenylate synthase n=1 Tax=Acuticoccus sp. MNP-M23 TaxID=3072793 RepID=UPI002814A80C|nr:L-threonylcarbamoyladenylate synthase [Acuticoccus sp. MNP-M23]WMS43329.1 L-threonylcarbamoyladenylate synthase [Acuticoccus sp. MNP-M23]